MVEKVAIDSENETERHIIKENELMPVDITMKAIQDVKDRARLVVEDIKNKRYKRIEDEDRCKKTDCDYFVICNQT